MLLTVQEDLDKSSLEAFLKDYFDNKCPTTYHNDAIHCMRGKRRSFYDLLCLCKSYFNCDEKSVAKILIDMWKKEEIAVLYCSNYNIVSFIKKTYSQYDDIEHITPQEYNGLDVNPYLFARPEAVDKYGYSFNKIYSLANESDN